VDQEIEASRPRIQHRPEAQRSLRAVVIAAPAVGAAQVVVAAIVTRPEGNRQLAKANPCGSEVIE
jgi:hypothetical protein